MTSAPETTRIKKDVPSLSRGRALCRFGRKDLRTGKDVLSSLKGNTICKLGWRDDKNQRVSESVEE